MELHQALGVGQALSSIAVSAGSGTRTWQQLGKQDPGDRKGPKYFHLIVIIPPTIIILGQTAIERKRVPGQYCFSQHARSHVFIPWFHHYVIIIIQHYCLRFAMQGHPDNHLTMFSECSSTAKLVEQLDRPNRPDTQDADVVFPRRVEKSARPVRK